MKIRNTITGIILAAALAVTGTGCSKSGSDNDGAVTASSGNVGDMTVSDGDLVAEITIDGYGTMYAKLFPDIAPTGVENFKALADSGYYEGLTIHRVISDFMFQGGSLNGDGTGGDALVEDGSFGIETSEYARHFYGALCYANAMGSNTTQFYIVNNNTSQDLSEFETDVYLDYASQLDEAAESYKDYAEAYEYYTFQANYYRTTANWAKNASNDVKDKYMEKGGTPSLDGNYTVFGQVYDGFDVIEKISSADVQDNGSGEVSSPVDTITIGSVKVYEYSSNE